MYTGTKSKLIILTKNGRLMVRHNNEKEFELLLVTKDFFMFRTGENENSHIINIFVEDVKNSKVQKIKLIYKKETHELQRSSNI